MYLLAAHFNMPPTVQEDQPAVALDWLLAIQMARSEWEEEKYKHG